MAHLEDTVITFSDPEDPFVYLEVSLDSENYPDEVSFRISHDYHDHQKDNVLSINEIEIKTLIGLLQGWLDGRP